MQPRVDEQRLVRLDPAVARMVVRPRGVRAARDDRRERTTSAPSSPERQLDPPGELGLGAPDDRLGGEALEEPVARSAAAARIASSSPASLTARRRSTARSVGNELDPARGELRVRRDRSRPRPRSRPVRARARPGGRRGRSGARWSISTASTPASCAGRLDVAAVGEQQRAVCVDEQRGIRALEPAQVADVHPVRDEQRVDLERGERAPGARSSRALTTLPPARRAPPGSPPAPCPRLGGRRRPRSPECRRHSSRSAMLERCTSTTGTVNSSMASRIA